MRNNSMWASFVLGMAMVVGGAGCAPSSAPAPAPEAPAVDTPSPVAPAPAAVEPLPVPPSQPVAPANAPATTPAPAPAPAAKAPSATHHVSIANFSFQPAAVTIHAGDTVIWEQQDSVGHNVVLSDGTTGPILQKGQSYAHTFSTAGNFTYRCGPHPFMTGSVDVR